MTPEEQARLVRVSGHISRFSGPLPPPETLEKYNQIVPGAAERIIKMAENQQKHRHDLEKNVTDSNVSSQKLGLILAFVLAMTAIVGGILAFGPREEWRWLDFDYRCSCCFGRSFCVCQGRAEKELRDKQKVLPPPSEQSQENSSA